MKAFAARLHELCDERGLPRERGRQTKLADVMKVTPNAARKWLLGLGMPELSLAVALANWGNVNVTWLLQGAGPKRGTMVDMKTLVLEEALHELPTAESRQVLEYMRYVVGRSDIRAEEARARYTVAIDAMLRDIATQGH